MNKIFPLAVLVMIVAFQSCSKKTTPTSAVKKPSTIEIVPELAVDSAGKRTDSLQMVKKPDSLLAAKPIVKKKAKESIPKVITVNDKFASKSVDGRYYYDLQGHRYWRNNKDGKYYLFNKSMLNDDAYKKPE